MGNSSVLARPQEQTLELILTERASSLAATEVIHTETQLVVDYMFQQPIHKKSVGSLMFSMKSLNLFPKPTFL